MLRKKCKCSPNCNFYPTLGYGGMYYLHASQEVRDAKIERAKSSKQKAIEKQQRMSKIRSIKPLQDNDAVIRQVELNEWFKYVATIIDANPRCWNCQSQISKSDYRNSTGHIFPKSVFLSVATHPLNFVVVGNRCGCHNLTHRIDTFSKMLVWNIAVERFLRFEKEITEKHKYLTLFKEAIIKTKKQ